MDDHGITSVCYVCYSIYLSTVQLAHKQYSWAEHYYAISTSECTALWGEPEEVPCSGCFTDSCTD